MDTEQDLQVYNFKTKKRSKINFVEQDRLSLNKLNQTDIFFCIKWSNLKG